MINALRQNRYSKVNLERNYQQAQESDGLGSMITEITPADNLEEAQSPQKKTSNIELREMENPLTWEASRNHRSSHAETYDYPEIFNTLSHPPSIATLDDPTGREHGADEYDTAAFSESQKYVKWGVPWQEPAIMIFFTLTGIALGIGHHFFFQNLNGTMAGPAVRQQWAVAFGTAFSFFTIASLNAACSAAYKEYVWTIVRNRSLTFRGLDKLFALCSNPRGFLSWELIKEGKVAMLLALVCWAMTLAGIAPPSTLNVVPGLQNKNTIAPWPMLDWNTTDWSVRIGPTAVPSNAVLDLAMQAAIDNKIPGITPYATNSSYDLQFYGPSVSCNIANATQQVDFDYYISRAANESFFLTEPLWKSGNNTYASDMVYWTAFAPTLGPTGWLNYLTELPSQTPIDEYSNWAVQLPENYTEKLPGYNATAISESEYYEAGAPLGLWVQTANESFICTMGNASFDIGFNYTNGAQSITHNHIGAVDPLIVPLKPAMPLEPRYYAYVGVFIALTSMLSGNVTTIIGLDQFADPNYNGEDQTDPALRIFQWDSSSKMLRTGLSGCEDFSNNYWASHPIIDKKVIYQNTSSDNDAAIEMPDANKPNLTNSVTFKDASLCRNRTLMHAVQDLANNITIAMLATNFTSGNATTINATTWTTHNIYSYSPRNLFISYGIAIFVTCIAVSFGMYALHINGVSHSTAFSAVVATTRNPTLDSLCSGESLGALPLDRRLGGVRLRFGVIGEQGKSDEMGTGHVGFGLEDEVIGLERNGRYI